MNLKQLEQHFISETSVIYDAEESKSLFFILAEHFEGWSRSNVMINQELELNTEKADKYISVADELKKGRPLQYILGEAVFYGLRFKVNPSVLIPRPETEELVEWILDIIKKESFNVKSILDIGTGSGCIPIVLKKYLNDSTTVSALDVSAVSIAVAKENAFLNDTDILFIEEDILNYEGTCNYDLIVSNPPYIKENERKDMHQNVLDHEPHLALFVSDERPLIFYEAIADFSLKHLNPYGRLFFEINEYLGAETRDMLQHKGFDSVIIKKDMQGKDRMIHCRLL